MAIGCWLTVVDKIGGISIYVSVHSQFGFTVQYTPYTIYSLD